MCRPSLSSIYQKNLKLSVTANGSRRKIGLRGRSADAKASELDRNDLCGTAHMSKQSKSISHRSFTDCPCLCVAFKELPWAAIK
jgi:hypothetical protein